jgi:hypothetical protein
MTDKTFTSGTVIDSAWLNDVNGAAYRGTAVYAPSGTGAIPRTTQSKLREWVSVTDFGAMGDGTTDDSAAFTAAFASGAKKVVVPTTAKYYKIKNVVVPAGIELEGLGRKRVYTVSNISQLEGSGAIVFDTTGSFCMAFAGSNKISNINFYGVNKTCNGIGTGSGGSLVFRDVSMIGFNAGFGGSAYVTDSRLWNCHASGNVTGIVNFVDSHFYGCEINDNTDIGVKMEAGANDNTFVGCKIEWNLGYNWYFYNNVHNNIVGGVTDRSGSYGFQIQLSSLTVNGTIVRRSGKDDAVASAHFNLGNNSVLSLNGVLTFVGTNDDGSGNNTPAYIFRVQDSTSGPVFANGCDLTGYTIGHKTGNTLTATYSGSNGMLDKQQKITTQTNTSVVSGGTMSTTVSGINLDVLSANSLNTTKVKAQVTTRNASTGSVSTNDFFIVVSRGASSAAATVYSIATSTSTSINTTGATVNVTLANVAVDGSSLDVVATNTGAATLQIKTDISFVL